MLRGHTWVVFRGRAPSRQHSSFGPTSLSCALSNSVSDCKKGRLAGQTRARCVRSVIKMPQKCCRKEGLKISFQKFPKNKDLLAAWIRAVFRDVGRHFRITSHTMVCSRHFKDSNFQKTLGGRRTLRPTAVPSIRFS